MKNIFIEIKEEDYRVILEVLSTLEENNIEDIVVIEKEKFSLISFNPINLYNIVNILKSKIQEKKINIVTSINEKIKYTLPIKFIDDDVYILDSVRENDIKYAFNVKEKYFIDLNNKDEIYNYIKFLELCNGKNRDYFDRAYELLRLVTQLYYSDFSDKSLSNKFLKFYNTLLYSNVKVKINGDPELYFKFKNDPCHPRLITWVDHSDGSWGFWLTLKNIINNSILIHLRILSNNCSIDILGAENFDLDVDKMKMVQSNTSFGSITLFTTEQYSNYVIVFFPNQYCSISTLDKLNVDENIFEHNNSFLKSQFIEYDFLKKEDITDEEEYRKIYYLFKQLLEQDIFPKNSTKSLYSNSCIFVPKDDIFSYFLTSIMP